MLSGTQSALRFLTWRTYPIDLSIAHSCSRNRPCDVLPSNFNFRLFSVAARSFFSDFRYTLCSVSVPVVLPMTVLVMHLPFVLQRLTHFLFADWILHHKRIQNVLSCNNEWCNFKLPSNSTANSSKFSFQDPSASHSNRLHRPSIRFRTVSLRRLHAVQCRNPHNLTRSHDGNPL